MFSIFKKEFNAFFGTPIGYMIVGLFLLFNGLLLWYFKGNWNIFESGFADMQAFFNSTAWLFLLLVPAITMQTFSDEFTTGTMELLKTKPLTGWQIVLGKFWASLALTLISLLPTFIYAFSIAQLAKPAQIDWGSILGSYTGLFFLSTVFTAIGVFGSLVFKNQITAFITAVLFSFILFYGLEQWAIWYPKLSDFFQNLSLFAHYKSMSKGVLDSRDILYFISLSFVFLYFTQLKLNK